MEVFIFKGPRESRGELYPGEGWGGGLIREGLVSGILQYLKATDVVQLSYRSSEVCIQLSCHGNRECFDVIELGCVSILHDICVVISKVKETVHHVRTGLYTCKVTKGMNKTFTSQQSTSVFVFSAQA